MQSSDNNQNSMNQTYIQHNNALNNANQHSVIQYNNTQHNATEHNIAIQHNDTQYDHSCLMTIHIAVISKTNALLIVLI